jgi:carbon storage regulator CsrA
VLLLDRRVNDVVLIGKTITIKVLKISQDEVVIQTIATEGEEIYTEELLVKKYRDEITLNDFLFEIKSAQKDIVLSLGEVIRVGDFGAIKVVRLNAHCVRLGFDMPEPYKILRQEALSKQPKKYLGSENARANA